MINKLELKCALSGKNIQWIFMAMLLIIFNTLMVYVNYPHKRCLINVLAALVPLSILWDRIRMARIDLKLQKEIDELMELIYKHETH